jgi:phospholipid transport system substrate-binding protein
MLVRPIFLSLLLFMPFRLVAADYTTPTGRVQDLTERILMIIDDTPQDRNFRWSRMAALVYDGFDFRSMSQGVLVNQWQRANEDERRKYTGFFSQYLDATYFPVTRSQIINSESVEALIANVDTIIEIGAEQIPVQYKLKNNNGNWFVYDVIIDGVSLVENYHTTYSAIIKNEGMDGLTADVQRRINRYMSDDPDSNQLIRVITE